MDCVVDHTPKSSEIRRPANRDGHLTVSPAARLAPQSGHVCRNPPIATHRSLPPSHGNHPRPPPPRRPHGWPRPPSSGGPARRWPSSPRPPVPAPAPASARPSRCRPRSVSRRTSTRCLPSRLQRRVDAGAPRTRTGGDTSPNAVNTGAGEADTDRSRSSSLPQGTRPGLKSKPSGRASGAALTAGHPVTAYSYRLRSPGSTPESTPLDETHSLRA